MKTLTSYQLRNDTAAHFDAVEATTDIDKFCSSLDWLLPAHEAFVPDYPLWLLNSDAGFVTLAQGFNPRIGRYLQPLEASWCLASAFVGHDIPTLVAEFAETVAAGPMDWELLYLSGIPEKSELYHSIVSAFHPEFRLGVGHTTSRFVARLDGGFEGWLSRRSSKFRANMRRCTRIAQEDGVQWKWITDVTEANALDYYSRILAVEAKSWKGRSGTGILDGAMREFYRGMLPRLARRNGLRLMLAERAGEDIAFIFGGVLGDTYRGLQMSFDDEFSRLSLGNLAQYNMIENLCAEGILRYDLGSELPYKANWAKQRHDTVTLWVWR